MLIIVKGTPAPQGSKRGFAHRTTGRVVLVESSSKVKPWRAAVKAAAEHTLRRLPTDVDWPWPTTEPLRVRITFFLPRPRSHYGTGRNADRLKDTAPSRPTTRPDLDKLVRSTLDALGDAGVWGDDSQVVTLTVDKCYEVLGTLEAGAHITVSPLITSTIEERLPRP